MIPSPKVSRFIASLSMGALCHLGRSSLTQTRATRGVAFATFCHMARWLNARCLKLVGRRSGPAFEPLTFVTGWIWLLSRADLHGDERGGANALRWWYSWYHAPQPRASRSTFRRRKRKRPEARGASGLICGAGAAPALCLETRMVAGCRLTFCEMYPQMYPQTVPDTPPP